MSYDITSASMDALQETPHLYVVDLEDRYDPDARRVVLLRAWGPRDIANQVRELHPGWRVKGEPLQLCDCEHRTHPRGQCGGGSWTADGQKHRCGCGLEYGELAA
jgi:hypothetical protein